jgi:hypothetical protein
MPIGQLRGHPTTLTRAPVLVYVRHGQPDRNVPAGFFEGPRFSLLAGRHERILREISRLERMRGGPGTPQKTDGIVREH